MKTYIFPSVIERHSSQLRQAVPELLHGLKVYENGKGYILGQLALSEGTSPHKAINSSPDDLDYRLLAKASLMLASQDLEGPVSVGTGFPLATYQRNRKSALNYFQGQHFVEYETGDAGRQTVNIDVSDVEVIPEVIAAMVSAREMEEDLEDQPFFLVNLGYGTMEAGLSQPNGAIQRTLTTAKGLSYALDVAMGELQEEFYLDMRTDHQFDSSFQSGSLIVERQRKDISETRRRALEQYYDEIISPTIDDAWSDDDFAKAETMILTGGGTFYDDLVRGFKREFNDILDVRIISEPLQAVSQGYYLHLIENGVDESSAVGLDIGNAHTVVSHAERGIETPSQDFAEVETAAYE